MILCRPTIVPSIRQLVPHREPKTIKHQSACRNERPIVSVARTPDFSHRIVTPIIAACTMCRSSRVHRRAEFLAPIIVATSRLPLGMRITNSNVTKAESTPLISLLSPLPRRSGLDYLLHYFLRRLILKRLKLLLLLSVRVPIELFLSLGHCHAGAGPKLCVAYFVPPLAFAPRIQARMVLYCQLDSLPGQR